jgi:hypothetical protein
LSTVPVDDEDVGVSSSTMAKRKKALTDERVRRSLGRDFFESHERAQRMLAERIAYYDRKLAEKQQLAES